jgi:hypothetical protein
MGKGYYDSDDDRVVELFWNFQDGKKIKLDKLSDDEFVGFVIICINHNIKLPKNLIKEALIINDTILNTQGYKRPKDRLIAIKNQHNFLKKALYSNYKHDHKLVLV